MEKELFLRSCQVLFWSHFMLACGSVMVLGIEMVRGQLVGLIQEGSKPWTRIQVFFWGLFMTLWFGATALVLHTVPRFVG